MGTVDKIIRSEIMNEYPSCITCKNFGSCGCDDLREREYLRRENKDCYESKFSNDEVIERKVAREILNIIEDIYFSKRYFEYRINYGSNGQRDLIIKTIREKYKI